MADMAVKSSSLQGEEHRGTLAKTGANCYYWSYFVKPPCYPLLLSFLKPMQGASAPVGRFIC